MLALAFFVADASIDNWTVLRFAGSRSLPASGASTIPIFGKPVTFYLFDLPFWSDLRGYIFAVVIVAILVYWLVARGWQLRFTLPDLARGPVRLFASAPERRPRIEIPARGAGVFPDRAGVRVSTWAGSRWCGTSTASWWAVDYTDDHFALPLYWLVIAALIVGAALVVVRRWIAAGVVVGGSFALMLVVPAVMGALYVKPNEISLERPYIQTHIEATRAAYGLANRMREIEMHTDPTGLIDTSKHKPLLDNVRLWDWQPFHDTVTQMQALRPYYAFHDTDVDRYTIDGQYRQVLLSPRELDINAVARARNPSWINPHFIYTHGYGLVLAEVSKITPDGQPVYLVQDMPPRSQDALTEDHAPRTLLRRTAAGSGFRGHGAGGVRLSAGAPTTPKRTTRAKADFPFRRC